jgi:hypothetical protein
MGKIKIGVNQFLGMHEYNRLMLFQSELGGKRNLLLNSSKFGLFSDFRLPEMGVVLKEDCFFVRKAGTPLDAAIVQTGVAIDYNGDLIVNDEEKKIYIPNDNNWYWVKISHKFSSKEKGKVSIDTLGNLSGVDTEFLSVLRGQPNFPTKIKFLNSVNQNVYEYEVVKILDNQNCLLFGDFNTETDLEYSVIGTFSAGAIILEEDKNIYQFDDVKIELIAETNLDTPPSYILGKEFYVSRLRNTGSDLTLQDKRIDWYKSDSSEEISVVNRGFDNPLIGVESVKDDVSSSSKDKNIVELSHGFKVSSFTIDTTSKKISVLIGNGGVFRDTSSFQSGQFDEWRLYYKDGSFATVIDSQKSGSQIVLTLDSLLPHLIGTNDKLFVCPPYESIEVKCLVPGVPNSEKIFTFEANTNICRLPLNSFSGCVNYNMVYRYKNHTNYTDWKKFPNNTTGYYKEESFNEDGSLKLEVDRVLFPYIGSLTSGFIRICENSSSYQNFKALIDTGDLFGVNTTEFANAYPRIDLKVGYDKKYQHFKSFGNTEFILSSDIYINLDRFKDEAKTNLCRQGNSFIIHISQKINLSTFKLRIVEDFINPTDFTKICEITKNDTAHIKNNSIIDENYDEFIQGILITCTFNEDGRWVTHYDSDTTRKGSVRMLTDVAVTDFDLNGEGIVAGLFGWKIMSEMNDKFPAGGDIATTGDTGGANQRELTIENIPAHTHETKYGASDANSTGSSNTWLQSNDGTTTKISSETGGETNGSTRPFDNRPSFYKFLFIKKIV